MPVDFVLLAKGFVLPVQSLLEEFGIEKHARDEATAATEGAGCYPIS